MQVWAHGRVGSCPSDLVWLSKLPRLLVFLLEVLSVYVAWALWGLILLRVGRILQIKSFSDLLRFPKIGLQCWLGHVFSSSTF